MKFNPIHAIFVPLFHDMPRLHARGVASFFNAEFALVGVVDVPPKRSLSTGAGAAHACNEIMFF
jgi:hypothetical protein